MSTKNVDVKRLSKYQAGMITPEQSRAARGWLDWSQDDLAKRANVALSTIRDFEKGRRVPIGNNLSAIAGALKHAGVTPTYSEAGVPLGISSRLGAGQAIRSAPDEPDKPPDDVDHERRD